MSEEKAYNEISQSITKEEISKLVQHFKSEEDIRNFVVSRVYALENESHEATIDPNNTCVYRDYISYKTKYKVCQDIRTHESPRIVYDDIDSYVEFLKNIAGSNYNEFSLFTDIMLYCHHYLSKGYSSDVYDRIYDRTRLYYDKMIQGISDVSIKEIAAKKIGLCSENAGLAQNIFKILGINSEIVIGTRDGNNHAYNIVFPKGYDTFPAVLYDPSFHIDFQHKNSERGTSFGYFKILTEEEYNRLLNGEVVEIETISTAHKCYKLYQNNLGALEDYDIVSPNATFSLSHTLNIEITNEVDKRVMKLERKAEQN